MASSPTLALLATSHMNLLMNVNLHLLKSFFETRELLAKPTNFTCQHENVPFSRDTRQVSQQLLCRKSLRHHGATCQPLHCLFPVPAFLSLHEELRTELFYFSLLLVKLWSIQLTLVYQPYSYLKTACQFIINSSNYIIAVKRDKWDWERTAAGVRDLLRPALY